MMVFRVDPMAARLWQTWLRRLTTQSQKSNYSVRKLLNEWSFWNSERNFLPSYGELGVRARAASGESWIHSRFYNVRVGAESRCGRTLIGEELTRVRSFGESIVSPFCGWSSAMQNSTLPSNEQDASQDPPSATVSPLSDVERSEVQEFIPENVETPRTPLVQAIRDANDDEGSVSVSPISGGSLGEIPPSEREFELTRVFVGGLPFGAKGDELKEALRELFGKCGTVKSIELARHRNQSKKSIDDGKHRGFAFVTMSSPEEAKTVIDKLNNETLLDRRITVGQGLKPVEPNPSPRLQRSNNPDRLARCKVFVGNLHEDTTLETLENSFKQYGTVISAKLIYELASKRSRGFGFIMFSTEAEAVKAILDLDGSILDGSVIRVNIAKYPQNV